MEVLEGLVQKAAAQLGLQPSKGQASRYLGVAKSNGKWLARLKGKTLGSFDLEIQAALAVRARQLDAKEASELDHTLEALKQVAPHLLAVTCGCGKQRAECLCKEKSLREAEAARAALEAIRAAAASPAAPVAQPSAPVPERPTEKAPKMKAAKAKASNPSKANATETALEKTGSSAEYYRLEKLRRQHALQRRRGKELRRRERRSQLEQRLQKRMEIEAGDEGRIRIVQEPEGVRTEEGARFASLRQLFLARLRRRRKRRPEPDVRAVQLERFGTMRVLSFWDAEDKLKWLAQQKEAREKFDHLIPSTPTDHIPSTPVGDLLDMPIQEFNEDTNRQSKVISVRWPAATSA
ncbi:unnamed protein product [Effrenium voratum]|nr:unnamed protein product [Effrenium voratum]